jgi:hypothetical protein
MARHTTGRMRRTTVVVVVAGLPTAGTAGAAAIYATPGTPGGPPTPPNGSHGTAATDSGATKLGNALAGFTASQLVNLQTITITVPFPRAGTIYGRIGVQGEGELGEGFAGRANAGNKPMSVSLSAKGRSYLSAVNTTPVKLQVKYAFQPNTGRTQYSTVSVVTSG